jgi:hypothetical protein
MVSPVTLCTLRGDYTHGIPDSRLPSQKITAYTTVKEFDAEWAKNPAYKLNYLGSEGSTALNKAATLGHLLLIEHIVRNRIGAKILLSVGSAYGWNPLFSAIAGNQRSAAKMLIDLGADVNMACLNGSNDYITPLSFAAQQEQVHNLSEFGQGGWGFQKAKKVAMAKLLIIHGAIAAPAVSRQGSQVLEQAKKEITEMQISFNRELASSTECISLPLDLVTMITSYVPLDEIPETTPELDVSEWCTGVSPVFVGLHDSFFARRHANFDYLIFQR